MKKTTFLLLLFFIITQVSAKIKLPNILGDNMVLQQQTTVKFWGEAQPNKKVTVSPSWNKKRYSTTSNTDGKWLLHLDTPKAGGPYKIIISDGEAVVLNNVLLGEVWFCSGQSNMTMPLNGYTYQPTQNSLNTIALANLKTPIRMCTIGRASSKIPLEQCVANWRENTPGAVATTSATAYFFAQMIEKSLEVPVGIIVSSWGGSSIETWMSPQSLAAFPEFDLSFLSQSTPVDEAVNKKPSLLFNAMIYPIHNYTIRGMLWYQGEANIAKPAQYELLQPAFVKAMRELWSQGDFPFYYVQIAPYGSSNKINTAMLREAQLRNLKTIPNSGIAVTMDIGDEFCIHPPRKQEVGERLAYLALSKTYKLEGYSCRTPIYKSMKIEGGKAYLSFDDCEMNVAPFNVPLSDFEIAGEDRIFYPALAIIQKGKGLTVSAPEVSNPVAVRYGFKNWVKGSLFDTSGLPISSFRTDNW